MTRVIFERLNGTDQYRVVGKMKECRGKLGRRPQRRGVERDVNEIPHCPDLQAFEIFELAKFEKSFE